jgi:hypothetical protein
MGESSKAVSIGHDIWALALQYPSMPYHPTTLQLREQEIQACDVSSQKMGTPKPIGFSVKETATNQLYIEK